MQGEDSKGIKFQDNSLVIILDQLKFGEIPDDIWRSNSITKLKIQKTKLNNWTTYPPLSWYEKRELKAPFWKVPTEIGQLTNLKLLQLVDLDIASLPNSITELQNLEILDLSLNKLNLSNELPKLKKLKKLQQLIVLGNHYDLVEMEEFIKEFPEMKIEFRDEIE